MRFSPDRHSAWPALALATACVVVGAPATAAPLSAELSVARAPGAEDCPDNEALSRIIDRIVGGNSLSHAGGEGRGEGPLIRPGGDVRADIQFSRAPAAYQALLRLAGAKEGERTLTDTAPTCTALGRAVGITMALLLDAALEAPAEPPPPAATVVAAPPPEPPAAPPSAATAGILAVTAGPALGLVGAPSLAAGLALELRVGQRLSARLDGQYVAPRSTSFDTGAVEVTLVAARLRLCGALGPADAVVRFGLCAAGAAGQLRGQGQGYAVQNNAAALAWLGAGGGLELGGTLGRHWTWGVGADVLVPLRKSTFSIENRGEAYRSGPVGVVGLASLGVRLW